MKEVIVKIRSDETTITEKFLVYDDLTLSQEDKTLKEMVASVLAKFQASSGDLDIVVKVKMMWE